MNTRYWLHASIAVLVGCLALFGPHSAAAQVNAGNRAVGSAKPVTNVTAKPQPTAAELATQPAGRDESYIIGIEDELQISVWHETELSGPVVVRPDGQITLPLLNDVSAVGLTTKQLQDLLTEKLKPFVTEPQVTITVRAIHSRKVYLVGQVSRAGAFPLNSSATVLEMLAEAGGLAPFAKSEKIYVLRRTGDKQEKLNFSYKKALKGGADFPLVNGDIVVVP